MDSLDDSYLRTDSPAGDVDSHNVVCVGVLRPASPFILAVLRTDTSKGLNSIESCCIVFQLKVFQKKESQEELFWPHVFPSTVRRMQDEDCGFD